MKTTKLFISSLLLLFLTLVSCHKDEITSISLNAKSKTMSVNEEFQLYANVNGNSKLSRYPISFSSSNSAVATVSKSGLVKALAVGHTTIKVSAGNKTAYCNVEVVKFELNFGKAISNYWGDLYRNGTHAFDFYGLENGLDIADNGNIVGTGGFLYLDINTDNKDYRIGANTYVGTDDGSAYTFVNGFVEKDENNEEVIKGSYFRVLNNSQMEQEFLVVGGNLVFTEQNNYYTISGYVLLENNQRYDVNFRGEIPVNDNVTPIPENLTQGTLSYFGDVDKYGKALLFSVRLGDKFTDMNNFGATGNDKLALEIGVPIGSGAFQIPNGTYPVQNTQITEPNYVLGGFIDPNNNYFGSWYYTADKFQINSGTVTFEKNGTVYTIDYDLKEKSSQHRIVGTWKGELAYRDESKNNVSAMSKVRSVSDLKSKRRKGVTNVKSRVRLSR